MSHLINLQTLAILYYDYFMTLPMEIERFWFIRKSSWATFLFFANRYLAVLGYLPVILQITWAAPSSAYKHNVGFIVLSP